MVYWSFIQRRLVRARTSETLFGDKVKWNRQRCRRTRPAIREILGSFGAHLRHHARRRFSTCSPPRTTDATTVYRFFLLRRYYSFNFSPSVIDAKLCILVYPKLKNKPSYPGPRDVFHPRRFDLIPLLAAVAKRQQWKHTRSPSRTISSNVYKTL